MRARSTALIALFVVVGCGGTPAPTGRPACDEIMERCHEFDIGSGPIHECHELSEDDDTTNAQCEAQHDHCFEICVPAADGGTDGGATTDASHDHPDGDH